MPRRVSIAIVSVAVCGLSVAGAGPAVAADISVTTAVDVVSAVDGVTSLREAVTLANATAEPSTINLAVPGPFVLDECLGAEDDTNVGGDLDVTTSQPVTLALGTEVVDQSCGNERILHLTTNTGELTLQGGSLTGGTGLFPGGGAVLTLGDLHIDGSTVTGNGTVGNAAVDVDPGGNLTVVGATITGNSGDGVGLAFGGAVTITESDVSDNIGAGVNLTDGHLDISGSTFHSNGGYGARTTGQGSGSMTVIDSSFTENGLTGLTCSNCGDLTVIGSTIAGNGTAGVFPGGGLSVSTDIDDPTDDPVTSLTDVTIAGNSSVSAGAGLAVTVTESLPAGPIAQTLLERTTVSGNSSMGNGGGISSASGDVELRNSTVSGNTSATGAGSIVVPDHQLRLRHATVVDGTGVGTDNVAADTFDGFGSIIATAGGADADCTFSGVASITASLDGDGSCGAAVSSDPELAALADNGGTTLTRLPSATSQALGLVPVAACTVLLTDQRGVARPQGPNCDAGSVEVAEGPPPPVCSISGTPGKDVLVGTNGPDVICGLAGDDLILGLNGGDTLLGGAGKDFVLGGLGPDLLRGESGADVLEGGLGADTLKGGSGGGVLIGGLGNDTLDGGSGADVCFGESTTAC